MGKGTNSVIVRLIAKETERQLKQAMLDFQNGKFGAMEETVH